MLESDIRPDVEYVAYNEAEGYGLLGVFEPGESPGPRDVAILSVLPNDLPRAAGVITTVPQTPLSHVNLRAIQNGTPNAFIRDALDDKAVIDLVGSYVYYRATAGGFTLRAATKAEVDDHHAASRPQQTQILQRDLTKTSITSLSNVSFADWTAFGVKAANVAELTKVSLPTATTPVGYAVPFYFHDEFMKQATVSEETILGKKKAPEEEKITLPAGTTLVSAVTQMLSHSKFQTDADIQEEMLDDLRKAIKDAVSPAWIISALTTMHGNYPDGQSLRYRSSTNNEDLPDFNGAGLYDSKTQDPDETTEDGIDKSIKAVWASLWNHRAFLERDFHRVDHTTVAMGVLVHPNYSDEKVNGVAVSFDPVTGRDGYYYVNSQLGEDLVTNPEALSLPEELLLDPAGAASVLSRSNLAPANQLFMTDAQMLRLRYSLKAIHDRFKTLYSPSEGEDFAVEIEFKITAQNKLAIKQARPWVFSQPLSACVPQLPTDAVTVDEAKGWRDANNDPIHVRRWNRVLAALGVDAGETELTAAESKELETLYTNSRWERTTRTLAAIELCHPSTAKKTPVVRIVAGSDVTEGGDSEFTMTARPVPAADLDVTVEVAESGDFGATTGVRTVTIPPSGSYTLTVATSDDSDDEANGSVTATLNSGAGYTVSEVAGSASVAVSDDDLPPVALDGCLTALTGDGSVTGEWTGECDSEGRSGRYARYFTFSLDSLAGVRIDLESSLDTYMFLRSGLGRDGQELHKDDDGGNGSNSRIAESLAAGDYTIEATTYGRARTAVFTLSVVGLPHQPPPAATPEISISAGSGVTEGSGASFTVTAVPKPAADLDVTVSVAQGGDFGVSAGSRTVTVPASGSKTFTVATANDSVDEPDGSVTAAVSAGTGYTVSSSAGSASLAVSDDDVPEVSVAAGSGVAEGGDATFTVTAVPAPHSALSVEVAVSQSGDFGVSAGSRTVTIPTAGSFALTVSTTGDSVDEADGSVTASVGGGTGYTVSSSAGSATVSVSDDDDPPPPPADCVSDEALGLARDYYELNRDRAPGYGRNWRRVLVAFGDIVDDQLTAFTAAEALEREQLWFGWKPFREALECIEEASQKPPPPPVPEISVAAGSGVTEGSAASFTVTASPAPAAALTVDVTVSQSGDFGAATGARTVTIPTTGAFALSVDTIGDSTDEADGSVTVTVDAGTGYTVSSSAGSATVAVADDDPAPPPPPPPADPEISIAAGSGVTEGGDAIFTLTASPVPAASLDVSVTVSQSGDFAATGERTVTIPTTGTATFTVATTDDTTDEVDGSVTATVGSGTGYTVSSSAGSASVAVSDDDDPPPPPPPADCVSDEVLELARDYYEMHRDRAPGYGRNWLRVLVAFGDVVDDQVTAFTAAEVLEREQLWFGWRPFREALECIEAARQTPPPPVSEVSVAAGSGVTEGSAASFTLTASPVPAAALTVDVTVSQSGDFGVTTGARTVTIPTAGIFALTVDTAGDSADEADGSVTVTIDTGTGYTVSSSAGSATVAVSDDDPAPPPPPPPPPAEPEISIAAGSDVAEGTAATFTLTASPAPTTALSVSVTVAQSGSFGVSTGARTVTIPTGGSYTLTVATADDSTDEADGSVTVAVGSGTGYTVSSSDSSATVAVADDDVPEISIAAGSGVTEGSAATFTVTASPVPAASLDVSVTVSQSGDFASIGERTVTIPTTGSATFTVATTNDTTDEADGSVTATVASGTGYTVSSTQSAATVAVSDDDDPAPPPAGPPTVTVGDATAVEGAQDLAFVVTLSKPNPVPITFRYGGYGRTATLWQDWSIDFRRTFTLDAGDTSIEITVPVIDDDTPEDTETLRIYVYATSGIVIRDGFLYATGTITDDD